MHRPRPLNRRSDLLDEPAFLHHVLRRPSASGLGLQAMTEEVESPKRRLWVSLAAIGEFPDSAYAVLSVSSPVVIPLLHLASAALGLLDGALPAGMAIGREVVGHLPIFPQTPPNGVPGGSAATRLPRGPRGGP